jgi:DeoR family transcriptional regulator, fructose operon transcriptional repressor
MMRGIRVRKTIMGAGGIVAEGVYNSNVLLVETERQMMACAQEVVIVADHTKFGRLSLSKLCDLSAIDAVVADPAIPDEFRTLLGQSGVSLHVAPLDDDPSGPTRLNGAARTEP